MRREVVYRDGGTGEYFPISYNSNFHNAFLTQ